MKTFHDIEVGDILQICWIGETFWVKVDQELSYGSYPVTIISDDDIDKGTGFYADDRNFVRVWDISELFTI